MRIRTSLVGLAAVVGALALAPTASAADSCTTLPSANTGPAFGVSAICIPEWTGARAGVTVTHVARAENIGDVRSSTKTTMGVQCAAESTGAVGTGIIDCYLKGLFTGTIYRVGDADALPGTTDASVGARLEVTMEPFEVCVRSHVLLREGSQFYETPLSCATN